MLINNKCEDFRGEIAHEKILRSKSMAENDRIFASMIVIAKRGENTNNRGVKNPIIILLLDH